MNKEKKVELLLKARNLLHKQENGQKLTGNEIIMAHDYVDMVIDSLVWENFEESKNRTKTLKLFHVAVSYGTCVVATEDIPEVFCIIAKDEDLSYEYKGYNSKEIMEFITEIKGYTVQGKSGIISWYKE